MPKRTRAGALRTLTVTGLTLTVTGLAPGAALATPANDSVKAPGFLAATDLPPHPSSS
ncbi:hypothetical protein ACFY1B_04360 [Streptomyces mirabilis]|uniref:hypothetical protein n=1 Tax=Streptomyces mirabilis TaxID=68239 RepID=UPI0036AB0B2F